MHNEVWGCAEIFPFWDTTSAWAIEGVEELTSIVRLVAVFSAIEMKWNKRQDGEREREETNNSLNP